jgi:phosphatidylglycerophosphate synthase
MLDITLRPIKDNVFDPASRAVPRSISPLHLTCAAFACGVQSCIFAASGHVKFSLLFWALNRALDCLDGAVARHRGVQSDLGGFLDLLGDFIVYSLIPISIALGNRDNPITRGENLLAVAVLEATFHVNNFVLFYAAALIEKSRASNNEQTKELTSLAMRPALIEGLESALFFTLMLALPEQLVTLSYLMSTGVVIGTAQRVHWICTSLLKAHDTKK